jgi:signal transduction histidine kinase
MRTKMPRTLIDNLPKVDRNLIFEVQVYPTGNGISVLAKDISQRRKLESSLEQYTQRLEELVRVRTEKLRDVERLATIGETAGMVGHDIRNPLQSIIGELYLAKSELTGLPDGQNKKSLAESIDAIEEQTLYINKIVSDLQDYAKALTPAIQDTDLEATIQGVVSQAETPSNVEVAYAIETPCPILRTDATCMKRILSNLTRNGIQAMQEKGGKLFIKAFPRKDSVIISISDEGSGIPEEVRATAPIPPAIACRAGRIALAGLPRR